MSNSDLDTDEVAAIYDELLKTYETEWNFRGHRSLHLEYYDETHDDPAEAAMNTMRVLSETAGIKEDDRVLNIGCGAGEDSVWNARAHGADVIGVNISERQLELARENAADHGVAEQTTFSYDDFHDLDTIDDDSIDVVWGLEALSHSGDLTRALTAARRTLRDDGRAAFTDLFLTVPRDDLTADQRDRLDGIEDGLGLRISVLDDFEQALDETGFTAVETRALTDGIKRCTERRRSFARIAHPVGRLLKPLGVVSQTQLDSFSASADIDRLIDAGALGYHLVTADAA